MRAAALLLAVVCTAALADGAPLATSFTPSPVQAAQISAIKADPTVGSVQPILVDANAMVGSIITLDVGGRSLRFIGKPYPTPAFPDMKSWEGRDGKSTLFLTGTPKERKLIGTLTLDLVRDYSIRQLPAGGWVLVEHRRTF